MRDLNIALVQAATVWLDARANRELYGTLVLGLAGRADLIVLPETFLSGFSNDAVGAGTTGEDHERQPHEPGAHVPSDPRGSRKMKKETRGYFSA